MKSIVCWLWNGYARSYRPGHVNVLHRMFRRCLPEPHRFICITDERGKFDPTIEVMPTPKSAKEVAHYRTPEGSFFPSCYRRLWMFSEEAACLGDRVMLIDIDTVLTADVTHLFDNPAEFVGWRPSGAWGNAERIGGGLYIMTPGTRTFVWNDFLGYDSIIEARSAGYRGSDQAWISYKLRGCELITQEHGIYSVRDIKNGKQPLPENACLIHFNGGKKPWHYGVKWVKEHWR